MNFIFSLIVEFFVLILFEILLEGVGYIVRRTYYFVFSGSLREADLTYKKKARLAGFDLSPNKQMGIWVIVVVLTLIFILRLF